MERLKLVEKKEMATDLSVHKEENPSLLVLQKIAKGLGVEIPELFSFQHEETDSAKLQKMIIDLVKDEKVENLKLILKIVNAIK